MIIDAHQHFWQIDRGDYGWLTPDLPTLHLDFMPHDLAPILQHNEVRGTVLVQAAASVAETEFLLQIADTTPFVLGVVGWVDFASPDASLTISRLAAHPKLVGLRPMIQDIADADWMLQDALTPTFVAMISHDLTFDALVLPIHLSRLKTLVARHPTLRVVIDHAAKPMIADGQFDSWAADMAKLATHDQVYCKLSGLVTEAGENWTSADLEPYVTHLLRIFGAHRLIWGSDWPVLTLAAEYTNWLEIAQTLVASEEDSQRIFTRNAVKIYNLEY